MRAKIDLNEYDFKLPKELIAYYPSQRREEARMMVLDRKDKSIAHRLFKDIVNYLREGDLVVRNISKVVPARIFGRRELTGGRVEILPLEVADGKDLPALIKCRGKLKGGERIILPGGKYLIYLGRDKDLHKVRFPFDKLLDYLYQHGEVPLPPYIRREVQDMDKERYQTVYAQVPGSVAAPTAGFHFSPELIKELEAKGVKFVDVILHVSYATFKPLSEEELGLGKLHEEYFEIPEETEREVNKAKRERRRIVAVGTTTVRALESSAYEVEGKYKIRRYRGKTQLFIYPPYKFRIVDALITNFHLPKTSLLLLVSAFCGKDFILRAYKEAVSKSYRFFSYGDCMLII